MFAKKSSIPLPENDPFYSSRSDNFTSFGNGAILRSRPIEVVYFPASTTLPSKPGKSHTNQSAGRHDTSHNGPHHPQTVHRRPRRQWQVLHHGLRLKMRFCRHQLSHHYALRAGNDYTLGAASEQIFIAPCLDRGWITVVPDYESETCAFERVISPGMHF